MNNLMCGVSTCINNENNLCCRDHIIVEGKNTITANFTCCQSYRRKTGEVSSCVNNGNSSLEISCDAINCIHNECEKCKANNIMIDGSYALSQTQTECATFESRINK